MGPLHVFVFISFCCDSFTCPQRTKWTLLLLSVHFTPPIHMYLSGAAVSLSSPSILECPTVWQPVSHVPATFLPSYPPFHLNFLPPLIRHSSLFPVASRCPPCLHPATLSTAVYCPCFLPMLSNVCCHVRPCVCLRVIVRICVSLCVTSSCRKLGWLTLIATRCLTSRYSRTHTHTNTLTLKEKQTAEQRKDKVSDSGWAKAKETRKGSDTWRRQSERRRIRGPTCVYSVFEIYMHCLCSSDFVLSKKKDTLFPLSLILGEQTTHEWGQMTVTCLQMALMWP